jgi:cation/acetate symporter
MSLQTLTYLTIGLSFVLYIIIAIRSRATSTGDFYVAGKHVHPVANGMATAADWMSAASFISMAGLISFLGYEGGMYLMGWTGGYVLLAMLLAPYLRKFGKFTVPEFIGDRYYSQLARVVAVICLIFISFTYVAGQMRGVGIVFSRFPSSSPNATIPKRRESSRSCALFLFRSPMLPARCAAWASCSRAFSMSTSKQAC